MLRNVTLHGFVIVIVVLGLANHVLAEGHFGITECFICHDFHHTGYHDCTSCHPFEEGYYDVHPGDVQYNLRHVRNRIEYPPANIHEPVRFTAFSWNLAWGPTPDATLADGDPTKLDGPCEVCHTSTHYHTGNVDDGNIHFDAENCLQCHPHFGGTNYFEPRFTGTQSHTTHWTDPKGPQIGEGTCTGTDGGCHSASNYSLFEDGEPLATTKVCNDCHSLGGAAEAKAKWEDGVYESNGYELKPGNENWCGTCHDDDPSIVNGVDAPNVMGDNTSYGYNITGHGEYAILCADCHDLTLLHTDGDARSYSAPADNYRDGYRLNEDMAVPRNGEVHPEAFRLCTQCHVYADITGLHSNFRDDNKDLQFHELHLDRFLAVPASDSDFDCPPANCTDLDSGMTCINCHNVHGSPTGPMIRHGELISAPGTYDKVPALDFRWYKADGSTPTTVLEESFYGGLVCGMFSDISVNHVCTGCHATGRLYYYRTPTESLCQCDMVPDDTVIPRGGTLGFQVTVTNNTDKSGDVLFATNVILPGGNVYPPSGFLLGPFTVSLTPGGSQSGHLSQPIPIGAPLGTYIYRGIVGRYDLGIFHRCHLEFVVVAP